MLSKQRIAHAVLKLRYQLKGPKFFTSKGYIAAAAGSVPGASA
jgi:hypothetical protein